MLRFFVLSYLAVRRFALYLALFHSILPNATPPPSHHAYISSHSSSSSFSTAFLTSSRFAFSFSSKSFRSSGHVGCSFSHGVMHSKSKMWLLWHGTRTTRGYLSSRKGLPQIGQESLGFNDFFGMRSRATSCCCGGKLVDTCLVDQVKGA